MAPSPPTQPDPTTRTTYRAAGTIFWMHTAGDSAWFVESRGGPSRPESALLRIDGGAPAEVLVLSVGIGRPAVDSEHIFFTLGHAIARVSLTSPHTPEIIAPDQVWPLHVGVDGEHVFWGNQSTQNFTVPPQQRFPGNITRAEHDGSNATVLSEDEARFLVVAAEHIYFGSGTSVRAVAKAGGDTWVLVPDTGQLPVLSLDGDFLYFTRAGGVSRVHLPSGTVEPIIEDVDIPLFVVARSGWVYVGANIAFQGPGQEPKPAQVLRVSPDRTVSALWFSPRRLVGMAVTRSRLYVAAQPLGAESGTTIDMVPLPSR